MALPIYTHIPNLTGPTKIFFKLSCPKGNLCGGVTVLNPKYPRLSSRDTITIQWTTGSRGSTAAQQASHQGLNIFMLVLQVTGCLFYLTLITVV